MAGAGEDDVIDITLTPTTFVRTAVRFYLEAKERREVDAQLHRAYQGRADELLGEVADMVTDQEWPAS